MGAMKMKNQKKGKLLKYFFGVYMLYSSSSFSDELPFSATQMGVCEFAKENTATNKSLRSLYSCKDKVLVISNASNKIILVHDIFLNEKKCKNHLFLDGEAEGPVEIGGKIVIATSCKILRIDLSVDKERFNYRF